MEALLVEYAADKTKARIHLARKLGISEGAVRNREKKLGITWQQQDRSGEANPMFGVVRPDFRDNHWTKVGYDQSGERNPHWKGGASLDPNYERNRYRNNRKYHIQKAMDWAKLNPDKHRASLQRRRARVKNAPVNDLTAEEWEQIKQYFGHRCGYCGQQTERLTQDHIDPLIDGGAHTVENVVPACQSCNSSKHRKSLLQWTLERSKCA